MIRQAPATYFDGISPEAHEGRLVFDEVQSELHFYENTGAGEKFLLSLDKDHHFEMRRRGGQQLIEWRRAGNHSSEMLSLDDLDFGRAVRDKFLANKSIFWRYATFIWSESLGKVAVALVAVFAAAAFGAWLFMQNSYRLVPESWDKKIGEQAEGGLKEFGPVCESPEVKRNLTRLLALMRPTDSVYDYQVQILKSPIENAFALPGGKITVFSETIKKARNYEELAGILAHEAGHVERRHGMKQISQYMTLRVILALAFGMADDATMISIVADTGALLLLLKNSRDHERDADQYAAENLAARGISSKAIRDFFKRIGEEHKAAREKIPDFVLTHPADDDRVRFFERYEAKHKGEIKEARAKLPKEILELLAQKPMVAAECVAKPKKDDEDEESDF